jgi:hypothetical protein
MTNTKLVSREPTQAMDDAASNVDRSNLPGVFRREVWRAMWDAAADAEPTFNLPPDEAEVARFRTELAAAIAEPYQTKAHVPSMHTGAAGSDADQCSRYEIHAPAADLVARIDKALRPLVIYESTVLADDALALQRTLREAAAALDSLRERLAAAEQDAARLRLALNYYASGRHLAAPDFWDSCSGEHPMWQFPDDAHIDETMVEGGWIALRALENDQLTFLSPDGKLVEEYEPDATIDAARKEGER